MGECLLTDSVRFLYCELSGNISLLVLLAIFLFSVRWNVVNKKLYFPFLYCFRLSLFLDKIGRSA